MIDEKLQAIMSSVLAIPASSITADTSPEQVQSWDSIRHLELVLAIEQAYGIQFETEQIPNLKSAGQIQESLRSLQVK